jgi:hypothetical protein
VVVTVAIDLKDWLSKKVACASLAKFPILRSNPVEIVTASPAFAVFDRHHISFDEMSLSRRKTYPFIPCNIISWEKVVKIGIVRTEWSGWTTEAQKPGLFSLSPWEE